MQCGRCQHENPSQAKFCLECGARLAFNCAKCRTELPSGAKFCLECGQAVGSQPAAQRFASPQTYTPKYLAERILTSKAALEGERKQVTVLFADLKGSMELLADRDPEDARKLLDPVLEHMIEAVHRYEGTVNQVMGDGIMALFGAPLAHEDHAVRACYAALRMQESVKQYGEGVRREYGITIRIRVGLNSGEVVVRAIGADLHMDYTAVGQTTHLAARLEQLADPGSILLAPDTVALAEGFVQVVALGVMTVRGLPAPLEVYELTGVSAVRSRLQATATRGLSRFVGRDAEIEHLRRALELARQGRGQLAALVGEPGVGKSRLVFELAHSHRVDGWMVLEAGSVSYGKATSYLPVIDLLKAYFRIGDRDTYRDIREKVTGKLLTLDRVLEPALPALLSLLDVSVEDLQWAALDPSQRRQRTLEAVKRLLLRETQAQPVVLVVEDLHWIDSETQALLDSLVESLPTANVLLLVSYRPEYRHGWGQKTYYGQLRLDPLPPESTDELLEGLLGGDLSLRPLKSLLASNTGGNPLFLEESVRTLVELRALVGDRGRYRLAQAVDTVQVPATVQAILAARLDRLPPEEKRLLETAAVIGKDVPFALLQAIAGEPEETLRRGLSHLLAAEFLYETSLFPDLEYTFKHALTHEVAYGSLLMERRRAMHRRIVDAIERLYSSRLAGQIERLAYHAVHGEAWEKAVPYLRQTGAKAFERSAVRESVARLEQALSVLAHLPKVRETSEQAIDLHFDLHTAIHLLGEYELSRRYLSDAERLVETLGDPGRLGLLLTYRSLDCWRSDDATHALAYAEKARVIGEMLANLPLEAGANFLLGASCFDLGDYQRAEEALMKCARALDGDLVRERCGLHAFPAVMARAMLTRVFAERGEFAQGIEYGQEGLRLAEALGHSHSIGNVLWQLGYLYGLKGDITDAVRLLERGLSLAGEWNLPTLAAILTGVLGDVYARSGRIAEGVELLRRAWKARASLGTGYYYSLFLVHLGHASLAAGLPKDAGEMAQRGVTLARERGERGSEAYALWLFGASALEQEEPDVHIAEGQYKRSLALAAELGMRPLLAHCHLGLGKLYRRTGDRAQAGEHLATATAMYGEMGMGFWLEQAEADQRAST